MVDFDPPLSAPNKGLGVCIPEHAKKKVEAEELKRIEEEEQYAKELELSEKRKKYSGDIPRFEIEGIYGISETYMLKGTVLSGTIVKGSKVPLGKRIAKVKDILFEGRSTKEISAGQRGALFIGKMKGMLVREGDVLELE